MLLLGEKDAGMHNHKDDMRTASFQAQILGRKLWNLCPPDKLSAFAGNPSHNNSATQSYMYGSAVIDTFSDRINYKKYPLMVNATCFQVTVEPGDIIYYPSDYWHQTKNLETPSLALSRNIITRECAEPVASRLQRECGSAPVTGQEMSSVASCGINNPTEDASTTLLTMDTQVCSKAEGAVKSNNWTSPTYGFSLSECSEMLQLLMTWPDMFDIKFK